MKVIQRVIVGVVLGVCLPALSQDQTTGDWCFFHSLWSDPGNEQTYGSATCNYRLEKVKIKISGEEIESLRVSGDGWLCCAGIVKRFRARGSTALSFNYKAKSSTKESTVTNLNVTITDEQGQVLAQDAVVSGGTLETDWKYYHKIFPLNLKQPRDLRIVIFLRDAWIASWNQENYYENIKVEEAVTTEPGRTK